jgi:hypothetical protein
MHDERPQAKSAHLQEIRHPSMHHDILMAICRLPFPLVWRPLRSIATLPQGTHLADWMGLMVHGNPWIRRGLFVPQNATQGRFVSRMLSRLSRLGMTWHDFDF